MSVAKLDKTKVIPLPDALVSKVLSFLFTRCFSETCTYKEGTEFGNLLERDATKRWCLTHSFKIWDDNNHPLNWWQSSLYGCVAQVAHITTYKGSYILFGRLKEPFRHMSIDLLSLWIYKRQNYRNGMSRLTDIKIEAFKLLNFSNYLFIVDQARKAR